MIILVVLTSFYPNFTICFDILIPRDYLRLNKLVRLVPQTRHWNTLNVSLVQDRCPHSCQLERWGYNTTGVKVNMVFTSKLLYVSHISIVFLHRCTSYCSHCKQRHRRWSVFTALPVNTGEICTWRTIKTTSHGSWEGRGWWLQDLQSCISGFKLLPRRYSHKLLWPDVRLFSLCFFFFSI